MTWRRDRDIRLDGSAILALPSATNCQTRDCDSCRTRVRSQLFWRKENIPQTERLMGYFLLAERQGFEPWVSLTPHTRSRRANSTTLAPLRGVSIIADSFALYENVRTNWQRRASIAPAQRASAPPLAHRLASGARSRFHCATPTTPRTSPITPILPDKPALL